MPKQVDHEQRRAEVAAALCRIAALHGLEAVSMREVAAAAGVSPGRVQHYFPSKDAMVRYTAGALRDQLDRRVRRSLEELAAPRTPLRILRALLAGLLPLDADGRDGARAGVAFFIRSLHDADLAKRYRTGHAEVSAAVAGQLAAAVRSGELRAGLDTRLEARTLLALTSGLASEVLHGTCTGEEALSTLDHHLDRLS